MKERPGGLPRHADNEITAANPNKQERGYPWAKSARSFRRPKNWSRRSGDPRLQFGRGRPHVARPQPARRAKPLEKKALETLGLPETAAAEEIRARYKDLVKRHHPDANGGDRSQEARLQEIIQAHKLLRTAGLC